MTCIAGVVEGDRVWMGGDSANFAGTDLVLRATPKVFRNGPCIIGCAGSARVRDVMRYHFTPPKHPRRVDVQRYMRTVFVDAMREALKRAGVLHREHEIEEAYDSSVLVAYRGRLFEIEDDFQVGESVDGFCAIGCGAAVAQGALAVADHLPPRKRLIAALTAAERYNTGVRRPFYVVTSEGDA